MAPIMKTYLVIVLLLLVSTVLGLYRGWPRVSPGNTKEGLGGCTKKVR